MTSVEEADGEAACGIGFSKEAPWNLLLRVKTNTGAVKLIKVDRFD